MSQVQSTANEDAAKEGGLRYVTDNIPGFTRKKNGKTFSYYDLKGKRITDEMIVARINAIGIPPAYAKVWICPYANGHIQATGLDARGRKQYRYHAKWREVRDESKFNHTLEFGETLATIRRRIDADLKKPGLSREKVLATVISLLEKTLIRVGNAEYARSNESYGLTTLKDKHVDVAGTKISFNFKGKSGKSWNLSIHDRRIANVIKKCADIPGQELFKWVDDKGASHDVGSADVNAYLRKITGQDFTAKDFRTWSGTVLAAMALNEFEKYDSQAQAKKNVVAAIRNVAEQLGNTPSVCRKCYIHPEVINAYMTGELAGVIAGEIDKKLKKDLIHLNDDEIMVYLFLKKRLKKIAKAK